jgi:PST family polysaccharide transporter
LVKLLKAMATTGGASVLTLLLGLATNKVLAVVLGPVGVGLLASYRVVQDVAVGLGVLGGTAAQVQALTSSEGEQRQRRLTAYVWLTLTGMTVFSVILVAGAPLVAEHFFRDPSPEIVMAVRCLAVSTCAAIAAAVGLGFVNVSGAIGWLALAQIATSVLALGSAWPLAALAAGGSQVAYVGLILAPLVTQLALATAMCWRLGWLPQISGALRQWPRSTELRHFLMFFIANVGGGLITAACLLTLRATIIETDGQSLNGQFQAAWTLAHQNLTLLMASFGTYILPTLSAAHDVAERRRFLNETIPVIIVLTVPLAGVGLLFMPLILRLLYSAAFLPAIEPLRWMLLGNLFSALIALYVNLLLARGRPLTSAITDVGWYAGYAGIGVALLTGVVDAERIGLGRLEGLGAAYFVMNCLRLASLIVFCRSAVSYVPSAEVWRIGALGFGLLLAAAAIAWSAREVQWLVSVPAAAIMCGTPLLLLDRHRLGRLRELVRSRLGR